ncbi:LCP family protein [Pseudofrankia inefficax]|uniref:Cell envelope-related transcriptional attenuator n=1 Tax=Pseudofrankia inefficax (strain DSM 45817 / CECT 9037 / DDB 130130 / EuI1c) TaxID=298654 RepID=E3J1V9_PSEI1|nr:LCP family protein [Pseudofrankia inefficax]ADP82917.1 cell envelope-related transcriptional attenuator [Pseudofrankia inefficax]
MAQRDGRTGPRRLLPPPDVEPRRPGTRRSPFRRPVLVVLAVLSFSVLVVSTVGWAGYRRFDSALTRENGWNLAGASDPSGTMNVLLLGSDSRAGTGGEYGQVDGDRSDTTIIAHFGADGAVTLLSFPRDTLVPVVPRVAGVPADGRSKLTDVLNLAGVPGLITTLQALTGLRIDHTISIDLAGFKAMTDAVGGVTVCVRPLPDGGTGNLNDAWSQWHGHLGENRLNGEQALAFVRTRHALGDERLRILRQQQFLARLLAKATGLGVLTNPVRLAALLGAVGGSLTVDKGLGEQQLVALANRLATLGPGKLTFTTIPTHVPTRAEGAIDDRGTVPSHQQVLFLDQDAFERLVGPLRSTAGRRSGAPAHPATTGGATGTPAPAVGPTLAPGAVTIAVVRNAAGRNGLAAQTAAYLRERGFTGPMTVADAHGTLATTEIHYGSAGPDVGAGVAAARTLAALIPGARLVPDPAARHGLVVILGGAFTRLATGGPSTPPPASTSPPAVPAPADTSCTP